MRSRANNKQNDQSSASLGFCERELKADTEALLYYYIIIKKVFLGRPWGNSVD